MILQRVITGLSLVALFVAIFLLSPAWLICVIASLIILLASWEYFEMTGSEQSGADRLLCLALASLIPVAAHSGRPDCLLGSLFVSFFVLALRSLKGGENLRARFETFQLWFFGLFYVSFTLSHFVLLRNLEDWKPWIFFILIVTYVGDVAAFFTGSRLGKRKLSPFLSPKKTVEGALGGLLASVLAGLVCKVVFFSALTTAQALWVAAVLSMSGQIGDLVESLVKRTYGIKDSGRMLPGHGGILDRIDSILFAGPVGYYLAVLI
jgi:phosphatidate cytidylyltransferase